MEINEVLNELLVKLFRNINTLEEKAIQTDEYREVTTNDMHVIEAIGIDDPRNMTSVAKSLSVTTGTLTIAINSLVKKAYVKRVRSEIDRRVVLVSLTDKGKQAYNHHKLFHENMISEVTARLSDAEKEVLTKALGNLNEFFRNCVMNNQTLEKQ